MEKKFNLGNKTIEVKLPNRVSSAGDDQKFYNFQNNICHCSQCEWVGAVDLLQQSVRIQSVNLLCPDCGDVIAEVSYHFPEGPLCVGSNSQTSRKFLL